MDNKQNVECSKCGGAMQAGSIMSPSRSGTGLLLHPNLAEWYAGQASSNFWTGHSMPAEKHSITVYRCNQCGYLECYAK